MWAGVALLCVAIALLAGACIKQGMSDEGR